MPHKLPTYMEDYLVKLSPALADRIRERFNTPHPVLLTPVELAALIGCIDAAESWAIEAGCRWDAEERQMMTSLKTKLQWEPEGDDAPPGLLYLRD